MTSHDIDLSAPCEHVPDIKVHRVNRPGEACEDCLKMGGQWVHLRACLTCGHVACCDSSPNRHATAHFRHTGHPIVTSLELGENWAWCYADETGLSA